VTTPPDEHDTEAGLGHYPTLDAIDRDLERLGELTSAYVTDPTEDLSVAAARITSEDDRREAEEILSRLRPVAPDLEAIGEAGLGTGPGAGPLGAEASGHDQGDPGQ